MTTGEIPPREDAFQPEQKLAELEAMLDTATGTDFATFFTLLEIVSRIKKVTVRNKGDLESFVKLRLRVWSLNHLYSGRYGDPSLKRQIIRIYTKAVFKV